MQTFLPYPNFLKSLSCLDDKRLGKQRVEARQILNVLENKTTAWQDHPAVRMWRGYREALALYYNLALTIWVDRGFVNNMLHTDNSKDFEMPPWLGCKEFHQSHQSNLLLKDFNYYRQFNWDVVPGLPYVWPE